MSSRPPIVIGHRGAPARRPEHTLASYVLAARLGADFLEPDLVATADGVLVARHEPELGATTDIADRPEFADRHTTRLVDGRVRSGWFVDDLTLAELRTLRAIERLRTLRPANTRFDGRFPVPTFAEILDLRERLSRLLGRPIGVYPETKHPAYFVERGVPLEPALVDALRGAGLDGPAAPVFVQSFDPASLLELRSALRVPLVRLIDHDTPQLAAPESLATVAGYADAVGVHKDLVVPRTAAGALGPPAPLVADAHALGLAVHAFTFRGENAFLPEDLRRGPRDSGIGDGVAECVAFLRAGVDGLFADHPDTAVAARALVAAGVGGRPASDDPLVHVAPAPVVAGLDRAHDRMSGAGVVGRGVAVGGGVAAGDVAAGQAHP
ncbi:MAG TPA: glycerophosphodiester phosphodiesterase family protein [Pseudonocardia sp.]